MAGIVLLGWILAKKYRIKLSEMTTEYSPFITGNFKSLLDMPYFFFATEKLKDCFHLIHVQFHGAFRHDCAWNSLHLLWALFWISSGLNATHVTFRKYKRLFSYMDVVTLLCVVRLAAGNNLGDRHTKYSHNLTTADTHDAKTVSANSARTKSVFSSEFTDLYFRYLHEFSVQINTL